MNTYREILLEAPLLKGIEKDNIKNLLCCLEPQIKKYSKNENVFFVSDKLENIAILLRGRIQIYTDDFFGNKNIITDINEGEMFAEAVPFTKDLATPVSAVSLTESEVMFINRNKLLNRCSSACGFHNKLIENLIEIIAEKNIFLNKKTSYISKRTTRAKILSYLQDVKAKTKSKVFDIPFNRQELADFLCVDRSALSYELSKLKSEGILDYNKNSFKLLG